MATVFGAQTIEAEFDGGNSASDSYGAVNLVFSCAPKESGLEAESFSAPIGRARTRSGSALVPVLTLVLWVGCITTGLAGLMLPYLHPRPPAVPTPPMVAELLNVELVSDPLPPLNPAPPHLLQPPPLEQPAVVPPAKSMVAVAAPSPQIAFAVPIEAPAPVVPVSKASYRTVDVPVVEPAPAAAPQPLTFGEGEGKQPAPEYPRQAMRQGQEGVVTVRLTVGQDGRILAAEASSPAPWPLLNDAALRAVRTRWRFAAGPVRAYEVSIRFQLNQ